MPRAEMDVQRWLLVTVPESEVRTLSYGANCIRTNGVNLIIHKSGTGELTVARNKCAHQGGLFSRCEDIEETIVRCNRHNWMLDTSTMEYTNPPGHKQPILSSRTRNDGALEVFTLQDPTPPWDRVPKQTKVPLQEGEVTITYLTHACVEIKLGDMTIITDPWLHGNAQIGWWLLHEPPSDAIDRLLRASVIYISHKHEDHLNIHTMRILAKLRPDAPIYVGDLDERVFTGEFLKLGFTNVNVVPIGEFVCLNEELRFVILPDFTLPSIDTWLLVEYKGHKIIDFADCSAPSDHQLPDCDVEVVMGDFSSGAGSYPSMFTELYGDKKCIAIQQSRCRSMLEKVYQECVSTKCATFIPIANYFTEAFPHDDTARRLNLKNDPRDALAFLKRRLKDLKVWVPFPGGSYDVATRTGQLGDPNKYLKKEWDFDQYMSPYQRAASFPAADSLIGLQNYFDWAGFSEYNLVLHMIEATEDFKQTIQEFYVDFNGIELLSHTPDREICAPKNALVYAYVYEVMSFATP